MHPDFREFLGLTRSTFQAWRGSEQLAAFKQGMALALEQHTGDDGNKQAAVICFAIALGGERRTRDQLAALFKNMRRGSAGTDSAMALFFLCKKLRDFDALCLELEQLIHLDQEEWKAWRPEREFDIDQVLLDGQKLLDDAQPSPVLPISAFVTARDSFARNNVNFDHWLASRRARRRNIHPVDDQNAPAPLINTTVAKQVAALLARRQPCQVVLAGEIASGKSSCVEVVAQAWLDTNPSRTVTVLPLTSQFSTGRDWSATSAFGPFAEVMASLDPRSANQHLFIVEDAHEGLITGRAMWTGEIKRDFSHIKMVVTCRPEAVADVEKALRDDWTVEPTRCDTNATQAAEVLAAATLPDNAERRDAVLRLFPELGGSLIALAAALRSLQRNPSKEVTIELAYESVDNELKHLFDLTAVQRFGLSGDDIAEVKLATLTAWMLGGIEAPFSSRDLAKLLDRTDVSRSLQILELMEEIFPDADGRYHVKRHPGWGLLVMKAIDEHREFGPFSETLRRRVIQSALQDAPASTFSGGLAALLFGVMYFDVRSVTDLAFFCVGRHMHDEFFQAATVLQSHTGLEARKPEERAQLFIGIASSGRRSRPGDPAQRQQLLRYGMELIDGAMTDIERIEDRASHIRLFGYALYERAYLELLSGNLDAAATGFGRSANHEEANPARHIFGIASASMQAIALTHDGKPDEARDVLDRYERRLTAMEQKPIVFRFGANHWFAAFEVALAARDAEKARESMNTNMDWQTRSGFTISRDIHEARLALLEGDFDKALNLARIAVESREAKVNAEDHAVAHRVMGDALLGTGNMDQATEIYRKLLPPPGSEFFDPQALLVRDHRLALLDRGIRPHDILAQTRV